MLSLAPVVSDEHVEWLRVQRNRPELYRYFRQDKPISVREQQIWWKRTDRNTIRLFIIENDGERIGYAGFNPFHRASGRAEFGIFIIPEHQHKGYATQTLKLLLNKGFEEFNLCTIYSDVLDYPHENRFEFYRSVGFEAFPKEHQIISYRKQNEWIPSIKFFMTKDMWRQLENESAKVNIKNHGENNNGRMGPVQAAASIKKRGRPKKSFEETRKWAASKNKCAYSGKNCIKTTA